MYRRMEVDRPTYNTLKYITKVSPHKIVKDDVNIDEFVRDLMCELYDIDFVREFENVTRSFYSLEGHYKNLWSYDRVLVEKPVNSELQTAFNLASSAFKLPRRVTPYSWNDLKSVPFISNSGAGYGYVGKKGSPNNHEISISKAVGNLMHWNEMKHNMATRPFLYTPDLAWTRTQLGTIADPKIRNVWGKAFHNIILEGITASPLIQAYMTGNYPITIGINIYKRLPNIITSVLGGETHPFFGVGIDYHQFDSSVQRWLIDMAFNILEENIEFTELEQRLSFEYSKEHFLDTSIVMPDGRMWLKRLGIPSGSYFTQLIGSIVNYISIMYLQLRIYQKTFKTYVLGDDSLFGVPTEEGFPDSNLISSVLQELSLIVHPKKMVIATSPRELEFLGHTVTGTKVTRSVIDLLKLLLFSEDRISGPAESVTRIKGLLLDSALSSQPLIDLYQFSLIRLRELGITELTTFTREDSAWIRGVLGTELNPKTLDLRTLFYIT